ncbi:hypothetical protein J4E85_006857 [Alternaria conjuncta]|uniref:uncharacterized protein n=1 Tax=Alternaria conjuncta TaxID=181017 RepID=UPI00221ED083|nr:uncharacterized protein J4E85_006857 [Alternaria conjuncta]KAI4926563.1 hypothetical protein J4E85_006857 [Alternaria conjuncta]
MVLSIALAVLTAEQVMNGLGEHGARIDDDKLDRLEISFWASVWVYNLTLTVTKISILVQYLRIFPVRNFRIACFAVLGVVVAYGGWSTFSSVFICSPVAFAWDKSIGNGRCMNQLVIWVTNAGVNIAQDVVIFLMPLSIVRALQIPKSQKEGLVGMFVLGASGTMVSIIRLYTLDDIANSTDVSFDNKDHATLSAVEVNVGIICACLPAMRPLFALIAPHYFSTAAQYTDQRAFDIERQKPGAGPRASFRPGTAATRTRPNTARTTMTRPPTATARTAPDTSRNTIIRPSTATTLTRPSTRSSSRPNTSQAMKLETYTPPRADSVQSDMMPLQPLPATLSRTASGRFSITNSRPTTIRMHSYNNHSRNASSSSGRSTQSTPRGRSATRFQGSIDPLRMSPVTPFSPPFPAPLRTVSPLALGPSARQSSSQRTPSPLPPRTPVPGQDKQLPLTPFPVGSAD